MSYAPKNKNKTLQARIRIIYNNILLWCTQRFCAPRSRGERHVGIFWGKNKIYKLRVYRSNYFRRRRRSGLHPVGPLLQCIITIALLFHASIVVVIYYILYNMYKPAAVLEQINTIPKMIYRSCVQPDRVLHLFGL